MIKYKKDFRRATIKLNEDGESGQATGWIMSAPYNADGGRTAVTKRVREWWKNAYLATGFDAVIIKTFGKKLTCRDTHGHELYTLNGHLYRLVNSSNPAFDLINLLKEATRRLRD